MGRFTDYPEFDALGLAELVRKKEVTPVALVEEAVERIEALNPKLNAVIHKMYDRAKKAASGVLPQGPFTGVPFLLKDLLSCLAGEPMRSGSRFWSDWQPGENSELVNRYLASGVVVMGKTNTPELGLTPTTEPELFGPTHNPWNLELTSGGSSGGTAAAVASRMVPMGGGGDGGGSIRIPSSCCGIFGLKPSRGRSPTGPQEPEVWEGCAVEHVLTRSVRDSAAMLDAVSGPFVGDVHQLPKPASPFLAEVDKPPGKLRIAFSPEPMLPAELHPDCRVALDDAVALLGELGHEVVEAAPPIDSELFARSFVLMVAGNTWAVMHQGELDTGRKARRAYFERTSWLVRMMGSARSAGEYVAAMRYLQKSAREVHVFMQGHDLLLHPTLPKPPQPFGFLRSRGVDAAAESVVSALSLSPLLKADAFLDRAAAAACEFISFTGVFNVTGQPSMSVPLHWNGDGLPVGVMLTGRFGDEATLFRLAGQLEQARPWKDRKPPVCA